MTRSGTEENRVAGVDAPDAVDHDIFDLGSVNGSDGNGAAIGVEYGYILEPEVLELTSGVGSELDSVGAGTADAVLDEDILADTILAVALEAVYIVSGIEIAIPDYHVAAVHYIDSVVVPVGLGIDRDSVDEDVPALVVLLVPATRILQGDILDGYSGTLVEVDVLRTLLLYHTVVGKFVLHQSEVDEIRITDSDVEAAAVDHSAAAYSDILLADRKYQGGPLGIRIPHIVERIQGTEYCGISVDAEQHIALEIEGTAHVVSLVKDQTSAAMGGHEIDGRLDAGGVQRYAVRHCAEITCVIICRI